MTKAFKAGFQRAAHRVVPGTGLIDGSNGQLGGLWPSLLGGEMTACLDGAPVPYVERFDRVGRVDHAPDFRAAAAFEAVWMGFTSRSSTSQSFSEASRTVFRIM
jgi:hypothetical protein